MNRKIVLSSLSIVGALVIMGGATFAAFTSTATAENNTFASGNAELLVSTDGETFASTVPGFNGSDEVYPGYSETFNFSLKNNSLSGIDLNTIAKIVGVTGTGNTELLQDAMTVTFVCAGNPIAGPYSVNAWEAGQAQISANLAPTIEIACQMVVDVPTSATNDIANSSVEFDVQFDATQVVTE